MPQDCLSSCDDAMGSSARVTCIDGHVRLPSPSERGHEALEEGDAGGLGHTEHHDTKAVGRLLVVLETGTAPARPEAARGKRRASALRHPGGNTRAALLTSPECDAHRSNAWQSLLWIPPLRLSVVHLVRYAACHRANPAAGLRSLPRVAKAECVCGVARCVARALSPATGRSSTAVFPPPGSLLSSVTPRQLVTVPRPAAHQPACFQGAPW